MDETDAWGALFEHGKHVIFETAGEAACAEVDAVGGIVNGSQEAVNISTVAEDAGQTENGVWRVVGVNIECAACFEGNGGDFGKEVGEVVFELKSLASPFTIRSWLTRSRWNPALLLNSLKSTVSIPPARACFLMRLRLRGFPV